MKNDDMKAGRYLRWHKARSRIARICEHLRGGGKVVIGTNTRATVYDSRHVGMFRANRFGAYVRHGKKWDCIDFSGIRFV